MLKLPAVDYKTRHPLDVEKTARASVMLTDTTSAIAAHLGKGSISAGIRFALLDYADRNGLLDEALKLELLLDGLPQGDDAD